MSDVENDRKIMLRLLQRRQTGQSVFLHNGQDLEAQGWGQVAETSYTMCPSKYLESMGLRSSRFVINFPLKNTYDLGERGMLKQDSF